MSAWRIFAQTLARNPISTFAVFCVASTAGWLGYMSYRLLGVVASPDWCSKAIQAERISPGTTFVGLTACVDMLKIQLGGAVSAFHIVLGSFSFSLIVLVVVVVAGAKASGKLGSSGVEFDVGKEREDAAAQHVVEGAKDAAAEVKGATP